jgi:uncharacterized protein
MKALLLFVVLALAQSWAHAQEFDFQAPASASDPKTPAVMKDLAERILPVYQENDPERYLRNLSALQTVAGNYAAAYQSRQQLADRRKAPDPRRPAPVSGSVIYDIYVRARAREADGKGPFPQSYAQAYWAVVTKLSDPDAYTLSGWLATPIEHSRDAVQRAFDQWRSKGSIPQADAVELIYAYFQYEAYSSFHPLVAGLNAEDDARRYEVEWDVLIETPDKASISAVVVRPKDETRRLPTLLEFTIYVDSHNFARECAAHGYIGIVAFTRGERRSPGVVTPFRHDGEDARAVINWIAKQPWSDGRVGMYGGTYSAFTQWAATSARHLPPALKAIATTSATAPGIDFPMTGNIVRNAGYRWSGCVTNASEFDEKTCGDDARWRAIDEDWYTSGKPYRELEHALGTRNRIFHDWLDHPSYDRYWQKFIPYKEQFAHINIPVLATTGYYGSGEVGTLYYFMQHHHYDPKANQTLLIGPYDDGSMQHGAPANFQGYQTDQAAQIDLRDLRYQWFDYIFKGGEKPALLQDKVNFEVMGANEWQHAPSLEAMSKGVLKFYLDAGADNNGTRHLSLRKTSDSTFTPLNVNFADRGDAAQPLNTSVLIRSLQPRNAVVFVSEPLKHAQEFSGLFSGHLDFTVNKSDMDLNITLYELLPSGDYIQLFDPAYEFRASYAHDRINRQLLRAGERQQLAFKSDRLTSRKLEAGSRLVMVLGVNKRPDRQINYGTDGAVNEQSIEDARVPLKIRWYSDSYLDIPVRR